MPKLLSLQRQTDSTLKLILSDLNMTIQRLKNIKQIPVWLFALLVSVIYCAIILSIEFRNVPIDGLYSLCVTSSQFGVVAFCTFGLILLLSANRWLFALFCPILFVFSSVMCFFNITIGTTLTPVAIEIALINNATMWWSMISPGLILVIVASLAISCLIALCRFRYIKPDRTSSCITFFVGLAIVLLPTLFVSRLSAPVGGRLPYSIYFSFKDYFLSRKEIKEVRDNYEHESALAGVNSPDIIFVLGESLRADHLPFNGYERNTMPHLSKADNLVSFPHIYSEYTYTDISVPHIMTNADAANPDRAYTEQSFITLFKNAGYKTAWFANQDLSRSYAYFAHEADTLAYCNVGQSLYSYVKWLDSDMLPSIRQWLTSGSGDEKHMAVVHTIGSHWWYKSHYTDSHARFSPEVTHKDIGGLTTEQMINSYDNTIIATDEFLAGLLNLIKGRNAVLFYISDHGESLGEDGVFMHGADTPPLHHPACLVIYSDEYAKHYPDKIKNLHDNQSRVDSTDVVFHTLLDIADIKTSVLKPEKSLTNQPTRNLLQ